MKLTCVKFFEDWRTALEPSSSTMSPTTSIGSLKEPTPLLLTTAPSATFLPAALRIGSCLWAQLVVEHVMVRDDEAVVELRSLATAKDGPIWTLQWSRVFLTRIEI